MAAMLMDQARTVFDDYKKQSMHDQLAFRESSEDFNLMTRSMQCQQRENSHVWNGMSYGPSTLSGMNAMGPYGMGGMNRMGYGDMGNPYSMSGYGQYGGLGYGAGYGGMGAYAGAYGVGGFMNPMAMNNPMLAGAALNASMAYPLAGAGYPMAGAGMNPLNSMYSRTSGGFGYF